MDIVYHHNFLPKALILTAPDGSQITIDKPSERRRIKKNT